MRDVNEGGTHTHTHIEGEIDCVGERWGRCDKQRERGKGGTIKRE